MNTLTIITIRSYDLLSLTKQLTKLRNSIQSNTIVTYTNTVRVQIYSNHVSLFYIQRDKIIK